MVQQLKPLPKGKVEVTLDLSEALFPEVPAEINTRPLHPVLTYKRLIAMRKAFVHYAHTAPRDGLTGELSQVYQNFFCRR